MCVHAAPVPRSKFERAQKGKGPTNKVLGAADGRAYALHDVEELRPEVDRLVVPVRVRVGELDDVGLPGHVRRAVHRVPPQPDAHGLPRPVRVQRRQILDEGLRDLRRAVAKVVVDEREFERKAQEV